MRSWRSIKDEELEQMQTNLNEKDVNLESELKKLEKDSVRTQLLLLMNNYHPEDEHEIMTLHFLMRIEYQGCCNRSERVGNNCDTGSIFRKKQYYMGSKC